MPGDEAARDRLIAMFEQRMDDQARKLARGEIDIGSWQVTMREDLRKVHALELIAGAGGDKQNVADNDWLKLGSELRSQYLYLEDFGRAIANGELSEDAMAARATMYAHSGKVSYWRQVTKDYDLPAQPADGSTICLTRCGCSWVIEGNQAFWKRGKTDSCETCIQREKDWNPYVIDA